MVRGTPSQHLVFSRHWPSFFYYWVGQRRTVMDAREAYRQKLEAQLRIFDAEIEKWKAQASRAAAEVRIKYYEQIDALASKRRALADRLRQAEEAKDDTWEGVKSGLEKA